MTVELGSWYFNLLYAGIAAIVIAVFFVLAWRRAGQYRQEAQGSIMAVIKRQNGFPLKKRVPLQPDGWVRVGKGDYMLPKTGEIPKELQEKPVEQWDDKDRLLYRNERKVDETAMEWDRYPSTPFLGLKALQVPIRSQQWYENDPTPITWKGHKEPPVTAIEAQAHTRQLDAQNVAIRIHESEEREKRLVALFQTVANKYAVYILLGAAVIIGIINFVQSMG